MKAFNLEDIFAAVEAAKASPSEYVYRDYQSANLVTLDGRWDMAKMAEFLNARMEETR